MAFSSRDVYLILRAKDEGSRVVRGFSANLLRSAAQVQAQALRAEALEKRAEVQRLRSAGATRQQIEAVQNHAKALEDEARSIERDSIVMRRHIQQLDASGAAMMAVGGAFVIAGVAAGKFFYDSAQMYMDYQKSVRLTLTQVDGFKASMKDLSDIGLRVAKNVAVPFEQIQPALYDIFSSTNANLAQSEILLTGFAKAAVAGNTSIQNAARGTISIMNAFNIPLEKVNDVLDIQFELVRKGVGTYEEFATKLGNAIPSAARAQQSFAMLAAMLAFMTRNGLSAAMASTSAARALEAMSHPKAVANLEKLGIKMRDLKGNFLPLNETLKSLRDYLLKFPASDRVAKLVEIFKGAGGTIQARRFLEQVLLRPGELEEFQGFLKDMQNASGEFGKAYDEMASNAASKTQLLTNKWDAFKIKVGEAVAPALLDVVDALSKLLDKFDALDPKTQRQIILFGLLAAAASVIFGIILIVLGGLALLVGAIASAGTEIAVVIGIFILLALAIIGIGTAAKEAWDKSANFRKFLRDSKKQAEDLWKGIQEAAKKIKDAWDKYMKPPLDELIGFINDYVLPALNDFKNAVGGEITKDIVEALRIIASMVKWAFSELGPFIKDEVIPALKWLADWWKKNKDELEPLIWVVGQIIKYLIIFAAIAVAVLLVLFGGPILFILIAVAGAFMLVVTVIGLVSDAVSWVIDRFKDLWNWLDKVKRNLFGFANDVGSAFVKVKATILTALATLGMELFTAGKTIIQNMIDGIIAKLGPLGKVMAQVGQVVSDHVPHSPAKKGPLSGRGSPYKSGQTITRMLANGMTNQLGYITDAASDVTGVVQAQTNSAQYAPLPYMPQTVTVPQQETKTFNNTFNITTQEIEPRKHAAELGWELTGRM